MARRLYAGILTALLVGGGMIVLSAMFEAIGQSYAKVSDYTAAWRLWWLGCSLIGSGLVTLFMQESR